MPNMTVTVTEQQIVQRLRQLENTGAANLDDRQRIVGALIDAVVAAINGTDDPRFVGGNLTDTGQDPVFVPTSILRILDGSTVVKARAWRDPIKPNVKIHACLVRK